MLVESSIMHSHCVLSWFRTPKWEAPGGIMGSVRIKSNGFAKDILQFFRTQYACMKASSCIYTVFYHALRLLRGEASRCFTGTVRIKSDGFARDILHFFVIAVCLYESFIMHVHCVLSCYRAPKAGTQPRMQIHIWGAPL